MSEVAGRANRRLERALAFAAAAHARVHQERRGTSFPYVAHPIRVAEILEHFERDEDVIVAGFLHDTVEDNEVTLEEIEAAFSARVKALVATASEPDKALPWIERKRHTIAALSRENDANVLALATADKLDNVRAITDTLRQRGAKETWALFREPRRCQHWYYRTVAATLLGRRPDDPLVRTSTTRRARSSRRGSGDPLLRGEAARHPA